MRRASVPILLGVIASCASLAALPTACGGSGDDGGIAGTESDAGVDAIAEDARGDACTPRVADASAVDGVILGLPVEAVSTRPPIATPQVAATPPSSQFPKQIGILNLSRVVADAQSVVHMLAPMGLPYAVTTSPVLAIQHDMAVFFPEAEASSFDSTALDLLDQYVAGGGVVVMKYSEVAALKKLGGVQAAAFRLLHTAVDLTAAGQSRFPSLDRQEERHIPLGGDSQTFLNTWAIDVDPAATGATVLATFDDGKAAIVERKYGSGAVYTFGVDWRDVVLRNQLGRSLDAARGYVNVFEPATDTWMLMIRDIFDASVRFGVRVHSAPRGLRAEVLLSHDLDWGGSYDNALSFADDEAALGASATYFVHTKYVSDAQDLAFFGAERAQQLEAILAKGGRLGSHSVAHSPVLRSFPIGDGAEAYPSYAPFNASTASTDKATLFGELRVSKSLIDGALAARCVAHEVATFRAGNLEYHAAAPQTMERLGYRFDSTRAVGEVLGNFPFRATADWPDALDTSVFELPVTIEDQRAPRFDSRADATLAIIAANADNGAPTTLLVHPNVLDYKLNGLKAILRGLPSGVDATSIDSFAAFWRARDAVRITRIDYDDGDKTLKVTLTAPEAVDGLTLRVDPSVTSVVSPPSAALAAGVGGNFVLLPPLASGASLTVTLRYT